VAGPPSQKGTPPWRIKAWMIAKRVTRTISFVGKLGILVLCLIYTDFHGLFHASLYAIC
jgi:hypothetical protein